MRIAQVVAAYHPHVGGVETHVQRLALGCAETGDKVTVLTHQLDDSPAEEWTSAVHVLRFPLTVKARNYLVSVSLFRYLKTHASDFDLVHAHSYHTLMGHAAIRTELPFVFTPHYHGTGHDAVRAALHHVYRPLGSRQFRMADAVICNSEAEQRLVAKDFPWTTAKLTTILPGTDPISPAPNDHGLELVEPIALVVGRLERYKNVGLIIDAFRKVPFPASLVVVGEGPDRARLERYAEAHEPGQQVLFTGRIPDEMLHQLFARASVVVSASDHEAFGLSVAEGLASGARVLASAIPAHVEIVEKAGADAPITLVDVRDSVRLAEHLRVLMLAGRVTSQNFLLPSWTDFVERVREVYSRVCVPPAVVNGMIK
jgi:glycosyltransferase involved in cell wall biosynthesis